MTERLSLAKFKPKGTAFGIVSLSLLRPSLSVGASGKSSGNPPSSGSITTESGLSAMVKLIVPASGLMV
ncbi:MAG: hypothetical protein AAFY21_17495 [Cyanobacteria bacterium J06641_2]